ncbi:hypothetical protein [Nocardia mexicana]|uniref:TrbL/VirB6 plasmid conjugal transfer protein n=1 Tax=Nocardia mexicana TaxID=279262 RepID=A0A370GIW8_9NOCA|nr:hypothetical protein [Nocardia mexicana]RDI43587.1 hypothetical protein DFR68_12054 [Nocardia mexicana]
MTTFAPILGLAQAGPGTGEVRTQIPDAVCDLPGAAGTVCQYRQFGELGGYAVDKAANSAIDDLVKTLSDGLASAIRMAISWWVKLPSPELASGAEPGPVLASIRDYTSGLQILLMIAGILFAAARLALAKRGGLAGEAQESFLIFARAVFASMLFAVVITTGTKAGDEFSEWVVFDATRGDLSSALSRLVNYELQHDNGLGTGLLLVIALVGIISLLIQLVMLVIRQAVLVLVVAAIPMAAAAAGTGPGSQAFKKMLAWSLAFVLWKPVGALVYAIAFTAAGTDGEQQDPQLVLLGMILLVSVTIVLPALMRLIAPAVATLGGGGGAAGTFAGGALGLAMGSTGGRGSERPNARKVSEGESAPNGAAPPPPSPSGASGGGGRPMPGGSGGSSPGGGGSAPSGGGSRGSAAGPAGSGAGRQAGTGKFAGGAAASGGAAAAGGAGALLGAAVGGARAAKNTVQQATSSSGSQVRDTSAAGWDPDTPGPLEVRR